ncbi:UNVERIFIED_CONTAM: hypothetical protein Sradi_2037000 [Sesamum radiatum]|uniref:Uncharacterized protein n=1 Tax=Sesamum radiatum TaxID=300843 RepID=A0AAW2THC0_SESRA
MAANQTTMAETAAASSSVNTASVPESLQLHVSDHPGMILISACLTDLAILTQLLQFLMGLNDEYDHVCNQVLVMDPIPNVNKAYAMVVSVEKQHAVHMKLNDTVESAAMHVKSNFKKEDKRKGPMDKRAHYCNHCSKPGHSKDTCFKIYGTLDWYKEMIERKQRDSAQVRGNTVVAHSQEKKPADTKGSPLLHELIKLVKHNNVTPQQHDPLQANFAPDR